MTRYTIVFPPGKPSYVKGSPDDPHVNGTAAPQGAGPMIMGDMPDFVSPIDGKSYSGRAGLRDHCARHNVVPNAELKGLPVLQTNSDTRSSEQRRADAAERKRHVINEVNKHYR